jgi:hypothetical protein
VPVVASASDDADLQEVYDTERQLLYVACTRAGHHLLVTGVKPASEFLDDIVKGHRGGPAQRKDRSMNLPPPRPSSVDQPLCRAGSSKQRLDGAAEAANVPILDKCRAH